MKLLHYTLRNLLVPLLALFLGWGCLFYVMILHEIDDETDDSLENHKALIIRSALADSTLLKDHIDILSRYYIRQVSAEEARLDHDEFYDSTVYIDIEQEEEPVRGLRTWFMTADRRFYELTIETSTLEKEDMVETILWTMALLYLSLIGCILLVIHLAFRNSFKPLYKLLQWLKLFHLGKDNPPLHNPTRIEEFGILTATVEESSRRSHALYKQQKQFVENASHELQTPLAICLNKLELLGENPDCTESQLREIASLQQTVGRVIRLNKSLLLLSRIDNKQFPDTREICLNTLIGDLLESFGELYAHKAIHLETDDRIPLLCTMNESLATTLVTNLVKNAFVHNHEEGRITVATGRQTLTVANTGQPAPLDTAHLFSRFARQTERKESTGLGLAIVKSIADLYAIRITYTFEENLHIFRLVFR